MRHLLCYCIVKFSLLCVGIVLCLFILRFLWDYYDFVGFHALCLLLVCLLYWFTSCFGLIGLAGLGLFCLMFAALMCCCLVLPLVCFVIVIVTLILINWFVWLGLVTLRWGAYVIAGDLWVLTVVFVGCFVGLLFVSCNVFVLFG